MKPMKLELMETDCTEREVIQEINEQIRRMGLTDRESILQSWDSVCLTVAKILNLDYWSITGDGFSCGFRSSGITKNGE